MFKNDDTSDHHHHHAESPPTVEKDEEASFNKIIVLEHRMASTTNQLMSPSGVKSIFHPVLKRLSEDLKNSSLSLL